MAALWLWCAENRPDGTFSGEIAGAMVESAASWMGKPGAFVAAAVSSGFLEKTEDGFIARSWVKRASAHLAKLDRDRARQRERYARVSTRFSGVSTDSPPEKRRRTKRGRSVVAGNSNTNTNTNPDVPTEQKDNVAALAPEERVFAHWKKVMGKNGNTEFDDKRKKAVKARLDGGYSPEDLMRAVDGCAVTPHNIGQNERGERYDDLELICRTASHVDRFMANAKSPPRSRADPNARAQQSDRFEPGYRPPLTEDGSLDLMGVGS